MKKLSLSIILLLSSFFVFSQARTVQVRFTSTPAGATVTVQGAGTVMGTTPFSANLTQNRNYTVVFSMSGYRDEVVGFKAGEGPVNVNMQSLNPTHSLSIYQQGISGGTVYLNNQAMGPLPLNTTVNQGRYTVRVEVPGYRPFSTEINVTGATNLPINLELLIPMHRISIYQQGVTGGTVYLNNQPVGQLPYETDIAQGRYTVRVEVAGYRPFSTEINVTGRTNLPITLERIFSANIIVPKGARLFMNGNEITLNNRQADQTIRLESNQLNNTIRMMFINYDFSKVLQFDGSNYGVGMDLVKRN